MVHRVVAFPIPYPLLAIRYSLGASARRLGRVGVVLLGAEDQLDRVLELRVLGLVGRHIDRRAGGRLLFGAAADLAAEAGFAEDLVAAGELGRHVLLDHDVRGDARRLDRAIGGREVARRGQPDAAIDGAEVYDRLHAALAERARADECRALVVLQRTGDDLGRGSRTAIDQDDQRHVGDLGVEVVGL